MLLVAFVLAALCGPSPLAAQDATTERRALALFEQGRSAYAAGELEEAVARFEEALALTDRPSIWLSLGLALERLDRPAEAVDALDRYVSSGDVEEADALRARIARLRTTPSVVRVQTSPPGALVTTDGEPTPSAATPAHLSLAPGHHLLRFALPGFAPAEQAVHVVLGASPTVEVTLTPLDARLRVEGVGRVSIDGVAEGEAPIERSVSAGAHRVRVETTAAAFETEIVTHGGESSVVVAEPAPPPAPVAAPPPTLTISLAGGTFVVPPLREQPPPFSFSLRLELGLRIPRDDVDAVVGLRSVFSPLVERDAHPFVGLYAAGGADVHVLGDGRIGLRAGLGLGLVAGPASWLPAGARADVVSGLAACFELSLGWRVAPLTIWLVPAALELVVLNPVGVLAISSMIGVGW